MNVFVLLVLCAAGTFATPARDRRHELAQQSLQTCATRCSGIQTKFQYASGKAYEYDLKSQTKVQLGGNQVQTTVSQSATVTISVQSPCELSMKLSNVKMTGADVPATWASELEKFPLRFSFDDGLISNVCPQAEEETWALNIKRSILSTFQNALEGQDNEGFEVDVSGRCPTQYENSASGESVSIKRSKNLSSCRDSHHQHGAVRSMPYDVRSQLQNTPLLDSEQSCEHTIKKGLLQQATCTEKHTFQPFTKQPRENSAIFADVEQTLKFKSEKSVDSSAFPTFGEQQSLTFDHSEFGVEQTANPLQGAKHSIERLCQSSKEEVRPETPGLFAELVYDIRRLNEQQLKDVHETAKKSSCDQSARFFMDALPMCGTEHCVGLMVELVTSNAVDQTAELEWYTSLAFVSRPNVKVLKAILPLMDRAPAAGLLGISSMAHSYCRYNRGCGNSIDLKNLVKKIQMRLGESCAAKTEAEIQEIVYALKALGNIGNDDSVVPTLVRCFTAKVNPIEIRLAAVRALRRQSCDVEHKQPLLTIYKTTTEQAELRIVAFVELMRCPTAELIDEIKEQLEKETSNQVGSYVYSYLTEKRRSSDPAQRDLASMLLRHHFDQKFNRDPRRFSRYTELGFLDDKSNVGAHAQSSVIFSPEGFLPRQASLNLTVHLFGRSVNFLEIGARSEGLEQLMDSLTGPDGYFTNPNGYLFREKSAAHKNTKVRSLHDLYKKRGNVRENDHLAASTYIKVFGDEIAYYGFTDYNAIDQIKEMLDVEKLLQKLASERDIKFNRNVVFLETTMTIPTAAGLPLRLAVNGTAAINFQLKGKADLTKIMQPPFSFDIHAVAKPSAAVEIAAMLGIQTGGVRQGVKMVARMHTSTNFGGQMQFREGRLYNAKVSLPDDQMEIFDIQSEMFQVINDRYQEHPEHRAGAVKKICTPQMIGDMTGLKVCGQAQVGSKALPYPFRATVTLEKADPNLQSYDFMIETDTAGEGRMLKIGFDTPGSTIDRKMEAAFDYQPQRGELNLNLRTPFKQIDIEGQLKAAAEEKNYEAKVKLTTDKKDTYEMEGTFNVEHPGHMLKYALTAAAKSNNGAPAKLESAFEYDPNTHRSAKLSLKVDNVFTKPVNFKTEVVMLEGTQTENNLPKYVCKVDYSGPDMDAKLDSHLEQRGALDYDAKFEVEYTKAGGKKHNFLAQGAHAFKRTGLDYKLTEMGKFETSMFPNAKLEYELKSEKTGSKWNNEMSVTRGNRKSHLVANTEKRDNDLYYTTVEAKCDTLRLNHKAILQYQNQLPNKFFTKAELDTPSTKGMIAEVSVETTENPKWTLEALAALKYPGRELKLQKSIQEKSEDNYKMNTMVQWAEGKKIEVESDVVYKSTGTETEYTIDGVAKISGQKEPIHIKKHYKSDERQATYHWVAKRGTNVVYDVRYNWEGAYSEKQTLSAHAKSAVIAQFDYELNGEVTPSDKQTQLTATVKNNGKDWGKIEAIVPKSNNHDNKQIKGMVSWDLDTTEPKELMGEWKKVTDGKKRTHDFTFNGKGNGEHYWMSAKVEKSDYYKMNATIKKADKPLLSLNFGMKDPRHDVSRIAVDMGLKSFEPLDKHDVTAVFLSSFQRDDFMLKAALDCKEMGTRFLVNTEGSSKPEGSDKLYKLVVDLEGPNGHEIHLIQQAKGKSVVEATKATSNIEIMWAGRTKKIEHVVDMERTQQGVKGSSTTKTPFQTLSIVKETYEYSVATGALEFKHELEWNTNKKISVEVKGKNKDTEMGFDAKMLTSFETAKKVAFVTECQKLEGYWNCKAASNVNDKYKLSAYQEQANNRQKLGFEVDLPGVTKTDGHYLSTFSAPKYNVELQFKKDESIYKFAADLNSEKESGMIKIQTPLSELKAVKVIVTKTGDEYELKTERNGETEGTIVGQLRLEDQNQRIRLQFHDITTPFEFLVQNVKDATKQNAKVEVTMDPKGEKRTYGAEVEYQSDEERLTNAKFILTHPRRQMMVEMLRPTEEKIIIQLQPNVGTNRAPTKLELIHKKQNQGYKCEAKLSDPSLKQPIHAKFEKKQHGACGEDEDCELIFTSEFDYTGEQEKIVKQKLRLARVHDSAAKSVKRRSVNANEHGKVQKLIFENTIEQPATNLHVKLYATVERLETEQYTIPTNVDTGIEFKNKEKKIVQYSTVFDYRPHAHKPSAFVRVNTPHTWVKIEGRSDLEKKEMNIYLYQNDPEPKIVATITCDPEQKIVQLEARTNEDGDILLHVSARMDDPYTAALKVWHTQSGRRQDDADIKVQLDRSDLLKTKFFIRPALNRDLMKTAEELQTSVQNAHRTNAVRDTLQSLSESQKLLLEDFAREMQPMMQGWAEEQRTIGEEMGVGYQELVDNIEIYGQMAKEIMYACLDMLNQAIEQMAAEMPMPEVREYYRQMKKYISELPRKTAKFFEPARDYLRTVGEQMDKMQEKVQEAYNDAIEQLDLQTLRDAIRDFCNKLTSDNQIISSLIEYFKQLSENLSLDSLRDYFDDLQKQYEEYKTNAIDSLTEFRDQLMDYAASTGLTRIIEPIVEPITNLDVETKVKDFIKYVRGFLSGDDTIKQYWQQYAPHVTVNKPDEGRFEMEIPLPVKATSLKDLVDQVHPERLNAMKKELEARFSSSQSESVSENDDEELGYSVWDTIHKFKPASWNIRDQIPPFKSTAYLIGNQHIVTFDGHVFDFNAGCEYLLARDFHDGKFTILAAFERHQGQTILSQIRIEFADNQINLHRNGKIEVDGKAEQLPWQKVDSLESDVIVKVERRDHSTVLTTYDGIEVSCDAYYHVCQVTLPGRYHGKSSGLLGSNDNEPLNDFELADGSDNNDVNAMASHYSVNGDCKANEADITATDSTNNDCRKMFKSGSSPLRPCFGQVAPEPFHQMCLRDMNRHIKASDNHFEGLCNVTAAYLQACRRIGVTLTPPEQCVRCQSPEGNRRFVSGEEVRVTDTPQMKNSDVVFVVEERMCLKDKKDEIEKIAHQIAAKDSEARFAWVGFGGDGVHYEPHLHTDKDSTHFNAAALKTMVRDMTFESESGIEKEETDPMRAVLYAVEHYAFRSGVQKTIVLVTCQLCNHRAIDHHTLQETLLNQGIVMHVITTEDIQASQTEEPAGFDAQHLFDKSGATTGDRATLERPNDVCAVIAQETYGTVFSVKAVQTAAKKIAEYTEKAQEKNTCQICQCETSELAPRTVCTPCDIVQPASLNSGSFTGIADFVQKKDMFLL